MKKWSRPILIGALMLVLWTSACNVAAPTSSAPSATIIPTEQLLIPTATGLISVTETSTPIMPVIPITGENVVQMQCQFCVNGLAHAVFVFPDFAIFDVESSSPVTCLTAEVVNGKRVLVCNGAQSTSFNLKICSDTSNCLLFPVALEPCPLAGVGTPITTATAITPVFLSPINTLKAPEREPARKTPIASQAPTQTGIPATPAASAIPSSPAPTSVTEPPPPNTPEPKPTKAPKPTQPPANTPAPTSVPDDHKKPTKTPMP